MGREGYTVILLGKNLGGGQRPEASFGALLLLTCFLHHLLQIFRGVAPLPSLFKMVLLH